MNQRVNHRLLATIIGRALPFVLLTSITTESCTKKSKQVVYVPVNTEAKGIVVQAGNLPNPSSASGEIAFLGGIISTRVIAGKVYIPVEGTFSDASFTDVLAATSTQGLSIAERNAMISQEVGGVLKAIGAKMPVLHSKIVPEVGFFTAFIPFEDYARLSTVTGLSHRILLNPVISMARGPETLGLKSATNVISLGVHSDERAVDDSGRANNDSFSGLARIGVDEFISAVKNDAGSEPDGSNVAIGVSDTGVTLNHPAFVDAAGTARISYLKDFTNEGLIYFAANGKFSVEAPTTVPDGVDPTQAILISAQYLLTPVGVEVPVGDKFSEVTSQLFQVNPELKAALSTPNSGARLGVFSEASFKKPDGTEAVDLNHNGKVDDLLWAILIPDSDPAKSKIYLDISGRGDFRNSQGIQDWNASKSTIKVFSETIGFEIKSFPLNDASGQVVAATAAAIVGFDPGNHGSHVSGIIGARKAISNDSDSTRARGVAPNGRLMVNRVCANNGGCNATAAIIDLSMHGAEVINMSLGGLGPMNDGYGVQETVINRLTLLNNTLFVISAGNSGPGRQTVGSPSVARMALSVAATASKKMIERQYQWLGTGKLSAGTPEDDFMLFFSSRGPTAAGGLKPNISAPGTELSSIQLNSAPGDRSGLDVYWGTSMAAPTATGAVALLIDGIKRYNQKFPGKALSLDARTLHRVISASARSFDVSSFDVASGDRKQGQYSWIDQGHGMINLPATWEALKAERDTKAASAVVAGNQVIDLDYEVRVLRKSPNGQDYSGAIESPTDTNGGTEPKFGRGIYLEMDSKESLVEVQVARRLPYNALKREDVGDLNRLLVTSADRFVLKTVIYGSSVEWLKAGVLSGLDCNGSLASDLTVLGVGAVDGVAGGTTRSAGLGASNLQVCLNRNLMATLSPGDHGAIIRAFRVNSDGTPESTPAFEVPVYVAVPHATMAGRAGYLIHGNAASFSVTRNYVQIPEGTSVVKVSIEVPAPTISGNQVTGCSGVELMVLEGQNTAIPAEITPRAKARAINCEKNGEVAAASKRVVSYSRMNPKAGLWDIHVFGQYMYKNSPYTLTVEFAKVATSLAAIEGDTSALTGSMIFDILDSSMTVVPSTQNSDFSLTGLAQKQTPTIKNKESLILANADGAKGRTYDISVGMVNFSTGGAAGSDLDLEVLECTDGANIPDSCKQIGGSGGATDVESFDFAPIPTKFYVARVIGYEVVGHANPLETEFEFVETRKFTTQDHGTLTVAGVAGASDKFKVDYAFDVTASPILLDPGFIAGKFFAIGNVIIKGNDNASLVRLPVKVHAP
jgi:Subtilase family